MALASVVEDMNVSFCFSHFALTFQFEFRIPCLSKMFFISMKPDSANLSGTI